MVVLRSKNEIEGMKRAGDLVARALALLRTHVRAGVRLDRLDRIVEEFVHGIAGPRRLREGDIVGIDVGAAIRELTEHHGYGVVRELGGHGVGHELHEEPHISHFGRRGRGMRFREGMRLTIEPMINEGTPEIRYLKDGWTVVTADGKLSPQYEHTIAVRATGCEILTPWHLHMRESAGIA